ncbi:MAG: glyoxalase, partial [Planctomycetes bacterium]|nr:glyoxalase [Planctomycetota bacterium]
MDLGNFSVSLTVKDLAASRAFYEKLGFVMFADTTAQNYLILQNGATTVGLFQGMFEKNMLTFNPGWTNKAQPLESFTDVRDIQQTLVSRGIQPLVRADEASSGPASLVLVDP